MDKKQTKGIIIRTVYDDYNNIISYELIFEMENKPNLRLGKCKIIQED